MAMIDSLKELSRSLRAGKYSPGGYPKYWATGDNDSLSYEAIIENLFLVYRSTRENLKDPNCGRDIKQWAITDWDINWENEDLYCAHTSKKIEPAYPSNNK